MDVRLMFPNEWIGAADLQGKDVTLTIARVSMQDLRVSDGGEERKPVLEFAEMLKRHKSDQKRFVMNKTNARTIAKLYSHETDEWVGKRITLYATTCKAFGEVVDCIRIREKVPAAAKKEAA